MAVCLDKETGVSRLLCWGCLLCVGKGFVLATPLSQAELVAAACRLPRCLAGITVLANPLHEVRPYVQHIRSCQSLAVFG